jgi:hypothetical protein
MKINIQIASRRLFVVAAVVSAYLSLFPSWRGPFVHWAYAIANCVLALGLLYILGSWIKEKAEFPRDKATTKNILWYVAVGAIVFASMQIFACNFPLAKAALTETNSSPQATNLLGTSIHTGWLISFHIVGADLLSGTGGSANLSIPVTGSKGSGTLYVSGEKVDKAWRVTKLSLTCSKCDKEVDLNTQ